MTIEVSSAGPEAGGNDGGPSATEGDTYEHGRTFESLGIVAEG